MTNEFPWPGPTSIEQLHAYMESLPFEFDLFGGAYVAGGSIIRSMLGLPLNDVDVWVPEAELGGVHLLLAGNGWTCANEPGSTGGTTTWTHPRGGHPLDIIPGESVTQVCKTFDWRCSKVATDGWGIWGANWAIEDILSRRLICTRRITLKRLHKYQRMGFRLPKDVERCDVLLDETATFEQCFGLEDVPLGPTAEERMK